MAADDEEAGEYYKDALTGLPRRRRGKRKKSRGQYSTVEKNMVRAFQKLMAAMHYMDGELADGTARDFTVEFARATVICEEYSFENYPDVTGISPHVVAEELDRIMPEPVQDDVDIYRGLT